MDQQEVADHYAAVTGPLLTAIKDAVKAVIPTYESKGLHDPQAEQDRDGRVLATGRIVITREGPSNSTWSLVIGFGNGQAFYNAINLDVPKG